MMRIGHGYDVHAFGDGDHVVLGGVRIDCDRGLVAHSDGDVLIHALCDALLGAAGLGDIGRHFPDTDERFSGADSRDLLRAVVSQPQSASEHQRTGASEGSREFQSASVQGPQMSVSQRQSASEHLNSFR